MSADDVLEFWFQQCRPWQWFRRCDSFDALVRARFVQAVELALAGELDHWSCGPSSGLALVLLLDQFTRQIWRGQAHAFAGDPQALKLSLAALERGWIAAESQRPQRHFWLMPLLHSEDISVVAKAIPLLEHFADVATADVARRHLLQLQCFGRYPHRNAALGRVSSTEEVVFMQQSQR
ncbi:hypothetical protein Syncc8109_1136 [Synechococcus sp. WH 8109]|uniref:DUF924 family protein n=1 Tax=Synechococcus sp. WH 8109 TaxID=166314 RepID=UPI0001B8DBB3|nr:DUF924 family protein [Synechococcus sp. WH 8109]AHF63507.1 hypothetical protein Syncc8109_1136 [Synechococcus sp. WH 8109]